MGKIISAGKIFDNVTITASGSTLSDAINLFSGRYLFNKVDGTPAIQFTVTGSGTLKLELEGSLNQVDYILNPNGMSAIITTFGATSGPGSDGKDIRTISGAGLLSSFKIKATEDGGVNSITLNAWLVIQ